MRFVMIGRHSEGEILSGPEKTARRLYREFSRRKGLAGTFLEYGFDGSRFGSKDKLFGYDVRYAAGGGEIHRLGLVNMPSFIRRYRPDVIMVATFERFALVPVWYAVQRRIPLVYIVHAIVREENETLRPDMPAFVRYKDALVESFLFRKASLLCFFSEDSIRHARRVYNFPDHRIGIVDNGIDEVFLRSGAALRDENRPFTIFFGGDPARPEKGWDFFRSALSLIDGPLHVEVVAKDGIPMKDIPANVSVRVHRPMPAEALAALFRSADCFVCASTFETFSIMTAEAMASGLPPIVTRTTGITRFIRDGENGFVVDYGDAPALAARIAALKRDPERLRYMSRCAGEIGDRLGWADVADRYLEMIKPLCAVERNRPTDHGGIP
ncbi:MAG: glycosyltransferase family 4 protein [Bacteroidota bacterium]|nr:glycosyltransferase family 4 protein [Bacteroidota bacterium]